MRTTKREYELFAKKKYNYENIDKQAIRCDFSNVVLV